MKHIRILILCIAFALLTGCAPAAQSPTPAETLAYLERYDPAALDVRHLKNI